ncbi:hypothetical protein H4S07_002170, partial [Coemansia furcata]
PMEPLSGPEMTQSDEEIVRELGPKPKRMLNPYHLFCHITIRDRLRENPDLCVDDAKKGLGTMWTHFSKEEHQPHLDRFRAFTEHCNAELVAYYARARALVTAAYGVPEAPNPSDVLEWKLGKKPVLPPPPYRLYYLDVVKDVAKDNPGIDRPGLTKTIADKWKGVSRDVRQIYNGRSDDLKRGYNANVASYDARERALFKAAIRKVRESRGNRVSNALSTAQPSRQPVASASPCRPPQLARHLNGPGYTVPSLPTGFTGMPPLLPTAIGSPGSYWPIGLPVFSQPMLPPVPAPWLVNTPGLYLPALPPAPVTWLDNSPNLPWPALLSLPTPPSSSLPAGTFDVAAPVYPLASLWPAEITIPDQPPEPTPLSPNPGALPRPIISPEDPTPSLIAMESGRVTMADASATTTLAEPIILPEPMPLGMPPMSVGIQDTPEAATSARSPEPSFCADPPAPAETTPVLIMPVIPVVSAEPAELLTPTKKKGKKKRKHAADDDVQEPDADQPTSPHRKKAKRAKGDLKEGKKKKKHKSKVVVKLEENIDATMTTTNKENCQTGNVGSIM